MVTYSASEDSFFNITSSTRLKMDHLHKVLCNCFDKSQGTVIFNELKSIAIEASKLKIHSLLLLLLIIEKILTMSINQEIYRPIEVLVLDNILFKNPNQTLKNFCNKN